MKPFYYQFYGIISQDMDKIKDIVSKRLKVKFRLVDSEVWGDYYRTGYHGDENDISIYENHSPEDNEPHEPDHAEFRVLISIYDSPNQPWQRQVLTTDPEILAVELQAIPER